MYAGRRTTYTHFTDYLSPSQKGRGDEQEMGELLLSSVMDGSNSITLDFLLEKWWLE
jgi:hypothetical protein